MTKEALKKVYVSKPFEIRNADEYELENILDLFIDPTDGLTGPFDFSNSIIKGKMGSGKTMYLRANYAYYLHTLVPSLLEYDTIVLPVYIKLSDFQNIDKADKIYNAIIVKIVEEIVGIYKHLQSSDEMAKLHKGASTLSGLWATSDTFSKITENLRKLSVQEYVKQVTDSFKLNGSASAKFLSAYTEHEKNVIEELKINPTPTFQDVTKTCEALITNFNGKLLILFDEVGSLNPTFFKSTKNNTSYFETLMNQLRTLSFVRTKIAIYPHSYSDILTETRYGDVIELECDIENNNHQYNAFIEKTSSLIERYIEKASSLNCKADDVFEISYNNQQILEQLVNASRGNMRRLVHLLHMSMSLAFSKNYGEEQVSLKDILNALEKQGEEMENKYTNKDKETLNSIVNLCKKRSTYKFSYPYKSRLLNRFTNLSEEYNIINIQQFGSGRQGNIYYFDYSYCVYKDIPTHYVKDSEKIDKTRSTIQGEAIQRVAQLSNDLFSQSKVKGKIEGTINILSTDKGSGFINGDDGKTYLLFITNILPSERKKELHTGDRVCFVTTKLGTDNLLATDIEILK